MYPSFLVISIERITKYLKAGSNISVRDCLESGKGSPVQR